MNHIQKMVRPCIHCALLKPECMGSPITSVCNELRNKSLILHENGTVQATSLMTRGSTLTLCTKEMEEYCILRSLLKDIYNPASRTTFPPTFRTSSSALSKRSVRGLSPFLNTGEVCSSMPPQHSEGSSISKETARKDYPQLIYDLNQRDFWSGVGCFAYNTFHFWR